MTLSLEARQLRKVFNRREIFGNVSFSLKERQTLLVTGRNGSGKSTLVKIISDVLSPTQGSLHLAISGIEMSKGRTAHIGLVSPYLQMYDEFTALENLTIAVSMRGLPLSGFKFDEMLKKVFLYERRHDPVRTFSSGMKQRMKYAFALIHNPPVLILDEPTSNLDTDGIEMVSSIMREHRDHGILIVATNDLSDVDHFEAQVDLNSKPKLK